LSSLSLWFICETRVIHTSEAVGLLALPQICFSLFSTLLVGSISTGQHPWPLDAGGAWKWRIPVGLGDGRREVG
jgi:hypothetical protein